ncbi:hypothetical protein D9M68_563990 [compost metagenome]
MAAHRVDGGDPTLLAQRTARLGKLAAVDDLGGAQAFQVVGLAGAAGGGHHPVAEAGEQGDGEAADATVGAGHQHVALAGLQAVTLQGQQAEHGGIAGGADGHGLARAEGGRQRDQPVTLETRLLRQPAPMGLADTPAVEQHRVAHPIIRMAAGLHRAGQVDARHHGELAHHRDLAGDGQAVLVVQGAVGHTHRDITLGQLSFVQLGVTGTVTGLVLLDQDCVEHACTSI